MNELRRIYNGFRKNQYLLRNAFILFFVFCLIFSTFAMVLYSYSDRALEKEYLAANSQKADNLVDYLDNTVMEMRYLVSSLETNELTKFLFSTENPDSIFENFENQVNDVLTALQYSRKPIEIIYLYSGITDQVYSANRRLSLSALSDSEWLNNLNPDKYGFSVFPYSMNQRYPFVICVAKSFTVNGKNSVIAVMMNLSKLSEISDIAQNSEQSFYLVSSQSELIYRTHQKAMPESIQTVPILENLEFDKNTDLICNYDNSKYALSSCRSEKYNWYCVVASNISDSATAFSNEKAVFIAVLTVSLLFAVCFSSLFVFRSFRPVHELRSFLERSDLIVGHNDNDDDIQYISDKTIALMQHNSNLRDKLSSYLEQLNESQLLALQSQINPHFLFNTMNMMYIQATDSLGYDHPLPQIILATSSLFRYSIDTTQMVTLDTELSYMDIYLQILSSRYGNNLIVQRDIAADALSCKVIRLFIQPILENAVFHGFSTRYQSICILTLHAHVESDANEADQRYLILRIRDNGIGMTTERLNELQESLKNGVKGKSIGLLNVVTRMKLVYGDEFHLDIESKPNNGTCFTLRFPFLTD